MDYSFLACSSKLNPRCIFVTGASRAGKTLLSKVLATTKEVEWIEEPYMMEYLLMLYGTGDLSEEAFCELFRANLMEMINEVILLRGNTSLRPSDINSIWNVKEPGDIFNRMMNIRSRKEMMGYIEEHHSVFLIDLVHVARFTGVIKKVLPNAYFIHVVRDAYDAAIDIEKKGWYTDTYLMDPVGAGPYKRNKVKTSTGEINIPYWVVDDEQFAKATPYERSLLYWCANEDYDGSFDDLLVLYENYVDDPTEIINSICIKMGISITFRTNELMRDINCSYRYGYRNRIDSYGIARDIQLSVERIENR